MSEPAAVVVGSGPAGTSAAIALRDNGFAGPIVLVAEDTDPPYFRPDLSKGYLRGEVEFDGIRNRDDADYSGIEMLLGTRVAGVDTGGRGVELEGGRRIACDRLLLATGGRNRRPPIPGIDLDGVFQLRTRRDSDAIREAARSARRVAVVGLGFIGTEVAASLRMLGLEVAGIEPDALPLARILGDEFGSALAALHRERGVELVLGDKVAGFEGSGRVTRVLTESGRAVECDLAVVGLGIEPAVDLALAAGAATGRGGIVVDAAGRTSVPGVFAAGDATIRRHPLFGEIHLEHWNSAEQSGAAAGASMAGAVTELSEIPSFWSDQFDAHIEYVGHHRQADRTVVRGSVEERRFISFYLVDGAVRASATMGYGEEVVPALERLVGGAAQVDPDRLADPLTPLEELST